MKRKKGVWRSLDWWTILIYMALLAFGWISICGASYDFDMEGNIFSFDSRSGMQIIWIGTSLALGFILLMLDGSCTIPLHTSFMPCCLSCCLSHLFLARDIKGSHSWIKIGPFSLQSAEFAKCATALALAKFMSAYGYNISQWRDFLVTLAIIVVPIVLIILQRETGSALVYLAFFLMLYREGMPGAVLFTGGVGCGLLCGGRTFRARHVRAYPHQRRRISGVDDGDSFTIGMVHVYCDKVSVERNILFYGVGVIALALGFSGFVIPFDITWILITVCVAMILYLCYVALSERVTRYFYIALFALGSMAFFLFGRLRAEQCDGTPPEGTYQCAFGPGGRSFGCRLQCQSGQDCHRIRRITRKRLPERNANQAEVCAGTGYRFHFLYGRGGRRVLGCGRSIGVVPGAHSPLDSFWPSANPLPLGVSMAIV